MADIPDWLTALLNPQWQGGGVAAPQPQMGDVSAFAPSNPVTGGGLLAGAMPPALGGLLTRPKPVPADPEADDANEGRSVAPQSVADLPAKNPTSAPSGNANVVATPASGTTEASSPGFMSKLGDVLGGIYGQGGPGDSLIQLGAGLASPEGWAKGVTQATQNMGNNALRQAQLQAFKLQVAQQQQNQNASAAWLRSKGVDEPTITAAISGLASGNPDLFNKLTSQYAGGNKYQMVTNPSDNSITAVNPYDPSDTKPVVPGGPVQPVVIGEDQTTGRKIYGVPKDGKYVPFDPQGGSAAPNTAASNLPPVDTSKPPQPGSPEALAIKQRGEQFLATLQPGFAAQVRAVAEGREPYPVGTRSAGALALMQAVNQYDPFFDKTSTDARAKTRLDFAAGGPNSTAGTINAGNTGIQHLGHLSDWAEELAKSNTSVPLWNQIKNNAAINVGKGLAPMNFDTVAGLVSEELTKFYRGSGGNEADIVRNLNSLKSASSPDQLRSTLKTITDLVGSKVNSLQRQWHQGMGPLAEDYPILQPESQQVLDNINQRVQGVQGGTPGASSSQSASAPPPIPKFGETRGGYRYIGGPQSNPGDPNSWQKIGTQM